MIKVFSFTTFILYSLTGICQSTGSVFLEAENFDNKGGWVVDQQFMDLMGSSYLMSHGMGIPVADAETMVDFPSTEEYNVYVRTFNCTSPWIRTLTGVSIRATSTTCLWKGVTSVLHM